MRGATAPGGLVVLPERRSVPVGDDGDRLDLDEHRRLDEPAHLDQRRRRPDVAEPLRVGVADRLPVLDVGDVESGPDDVCRARAGRRQRALDVPERLPGLFARVAGADDGSPLVGRRRSRDVDLPAGPDRPRVADR